MFQRIEPQPAELVMHETGTFHGVDYTITEIVGRRPGFRLTVDGTYLATLSSRIAAHHLLKEVVHDMIEQGVVGTPCLEVA